MSEPVETKRTPPASRDTLPDFSARQADTRQDMDRPAATILVVDDDEGNRFALAAFLQVGGFAVLQAGSGGEALRVLAAASPDLMILDVRLPDLDGFEVCRRVKADPETALVPVLLLSGQMVQTEDKVHGLEGGADGYLTKPAEPREIVAHVKALLRVRRAEEALRAAGEQWQTTFDALSDPICLVDRKGNVLRCNQAMAALLEKPPAEILGRSYKHLVQDLVGPVRFPFFLSAGEARHGKVVEWLIKRRWFRVRTDPVFGARGVVVGTVHVLADITERKRAEEEAYLSQAMTLAISESEDFHSALDAVLRQICEITGWQFGQVWLPRADGALLEWGGAWYSRAAALEEFRRSSQAMKFPPHFGIPGRAWASKQPVLVRDLAADPDSSRFEDIRRLGLKGGMGVPILAQEEVVAVAEFFVPEVREEDKRFLRLVGAITAQLGLIVRRKRAEEALRISEERFRALAQSANDAIISASGDGRIVSWNKAAQAAFGYAENEVLGQPLTVLMPERYREEFRERFAGFAATGEARLLSKTVELHARRKDGGEFPVEISLAAWQTGQGKFVSGILRDLTERKRLEEQFRQAQKMEAVGRLAGGVAHDFNNLLTIINGYSELLLGMARAGDPGRPFIEEIKQAGDRAAALTRQLLAFSRQQMLEPRVLDLNAIVGDLQKMLRRLIGEDVNLTAVLSPQLGRVQADPGQVEQVLMNLAVNARDAMPQGGRLTIETRNVELDEHYAQTHPDVRPGRYALLAVTDTGVGMDAATLARIFEPFFTTKGPNRGTGLGLATVYGIVKQSGGHVQVYSEPGQGTTFKIYLPLVEGGSAPQDRPAGPADVPRGSERLLLVEDEDAVRQFAAEALGRLGYSVRTARNGREALHLCERDGEPIDLLVTDVVMPEMSGRELADALARRRPGTRVLFLSGYTEDAVIRHGVLQADAAFLQKPFTPNVLARKVREVLDR